MSGSEQFKRSPRPVVGLVMTGGGARGAYQAGVLQRIGEIKLIKRGRSPFQVVCGASAGALNATAVAAGNHDFNLSSKRIATLWSTLTANSVYRTDMASLGPKAMKWLKDLSLGGAFGGGHADSLLDFSPLKDFLTQHLDFRQIQNNIDRGFLKAAAIIGTNYNNGKAYIFVHSKNDEKLWQKSRRVTLATQLSVEHVLASAAIPIVFQPIRLKFGEEWAYFGDGCLRHTSPMSPAIRLGSQKVLAIGVRSQKTSQDEVHGTVNFEEKSPPLAQILGVILNAIFLDHLDADVDHLVRLNGIVKGFQSQGAVADSSGVKEPMKIVGCKLIRPSIDLGKLASDFSSDMPPIVRYLMKGLGTRESTSADLMSYLLFAPEYTKALINIGYHDAHNQIDEIEEFLFSREIEK